MTMSYRMYYRKDGQPIHDVLEWDTFFQDPSYKVIRRTRLRGGKKWVSTVWLGIDHGLGQGPPVIFETMVFGLKDFGPARPYHTPRYQQNYAQERWHTEAEAIAGHAALCRYWQMNRAQRRRHEARVKRAEVGESL